jgi:hypothetical protein
MQKIFLFFLVLNFWSCVNNEPCNPSSSRLIQVLDGSNNGVVSSSHHIEVQGISLNCDSTTVMGIIDGYILADTSNIPIYSIRIFKSREHFDEGETLSQPHEYFEDQVIEVYFDEATKLPRSFGFYDRGRKIFEGNTWKR